MPGYDPDANERIVDTSEYEEYDWTPEMWLQGSPWRFSPEWNGRGLHLEIGSRAYWALVDYDDS